MLAGKNIPQQSPIMRVVKAHQMTLGEVDISQIQFDLKSRDDIPRILRGLQHLYMNEPLRKTVFDLLEQEFQPNVSKQVGRVAPA